MTTTIEAPRRRSGEEAAGEVNVLVVRDALGRAHYERMRQRMAPDLLLPTWAGLTDAQREPYRQRTDYLVDAVLDLTTPGASS